MNIHDLIEALQEIEQTEGNVEICQRASGTINSVVWVYDISDLASIKLHASGEKVFRFY